MAAPAEYLRLKVHPGSRRERLERKGSGAYELWVRAPAERGLANEAALALLARELGCVRARLRLVKGAASPAKIAALWPERP